MRSALTRVMSLGWARQIVLLVSGASLLCLAALGAIAARAGGASATTGTLRVAFWGALAMATTAVIGRLFGTKVS